VLASFDIVSLFANVPVNEAVQISNKLHNDYTLAERSALQVNHIKDCDHDEYINFMLYK
jgi:hypothetical protein